MDEYNFVKELLMAITGQMGPGTIIAVNFNSQFSSKERSYGKNSNNKQQQRNFRGDCTSDQNGLNRHL